MPPEIVKVLPAREWQISSYKLDALAQLPSPSDFTWVDFGRSPKRSFAEAILKRLANIQGKANPKAFFFISGSALSQLTHDALVTCIYSTFPNPSEVVADLVGKPDVRAALQKFLAQRTAERRRIPAAPTPASPLHVPNADLRTDRGRFSIKLIAGLFDLPVVEVGRLIGRTNKAALSKTPDADSLQEPLQPFADIALLRSPDFGDEAFRKWLRTANEHMQNQAPLDWIRQGRVRDVGGFVYGILTGQPT